MGTTGERARFEALEAQADALRKALGIAEGADLSAAAEFLISDIQRLETELKSITESEIGRVTELMDNLGKGTHSGRMIRKPKRAYGFTRSDRMLPPSAKYA